LDAHAKQGKRRQDETGPSKAQIGGLAKLISEGHSVFCPRRAVTGAQDISDTKVSRYPLAPRNASILAALTYVGGTNQEKLRMRKPSLLLGAAAFLISGGIASALPAAFPPIAGSHRQLTFSAAAVAACSLDTVAGAALGRSSGQRSRQKSRRETGR
jgi:hypothetical protein